MADIIRGDSKMTDFIKSHLMANLDENVTTFQQGLIALGVTVASVLASLPYITILSR